MMRNVLVIWQREMTACFLSPIAYVILVAYLVVASGTFLTGVFRSVGRPEPLSSFLYGADVLWLPFVVAVVSMRLFAEEKRSGTIETLMTAPVTEVEIVIGKYLGALSFVCFVMAPTLLAFFVFEALSPGIDRSMLDRGGLISGGGFLLLVSALFVAIGCLVSLTTRNQIIAAITTLCLLLVLLYFGWLISGVPGVSAEVASLLSMTDQLESFSWGLVELRVVILLLSSTWAVLFAATRVLESMRWR